MSPSIGMNVEIEHTQLIGWSSWRNFDYLGTNNEVNFSTPPVPDDLMCNDNPIKHDMNEKSQCIMGMFS